MKQTIPTQISVTPQAAQKAAEFQRADPAHSGKSLRIAIEKGGCSSYQYKFTFDDRRGADTIVPGDGVDFIVDGETLSMLKGSTLDFQESFSGSGFIVTNPNAKSACGCGQSFQV